VAARSVLWEGDELMIVIKSNESHEKIIEVETEDEAMNIIRIWEDIDRLDGVYLPNRYYIEVL
jgi:hypothetical protein